MKKKNVFIAAATKLGKIRTQNNSIEAHTVGTVVLATQKPKSRQALTNNNNDTFY